MANPEETDAFTEGLNNALEQFQEVDETVDAGSQDAEGKGESETQVLTREKLEEVSGRKFESDEDFLKHYENLKKLVGDQDLAKERKEKASPKADDKLSVLEQELAQMKKDGAKKDFLIENPVAKEYIDIVEAYAEKHNLPLNEAWTSKFQTIAETSQKGRVITNKNRITPVQSQRITELAQGARQGDTKAQESLVMETIFGNKS